MSYTGKPLPDKPDPEFIYIPPSEPVETPQAWKPDGALYWYNNQWIYPDPITITDVADKSTARNITVAMAGDPVPYVFGRCQVVPKILFAVAFEGYLYVDYLLSAGECNGVISLLQGGNDIGKPTESFEYFTGTAGQTASTLMIEALGAYDDLPDVCHFVAKLGKDDSMDFRVIMEGLKLYDPRISPNTAYSTNPALALARILTDCGYSVDDTSLTEVADYCDEDVVGAPRWTVNLPIYDRANVGAWVQAFSQYATCVVDIVGGSAKLIADQPVTSSPAILRALTSADIMEGSVKTTKVGTRDVPKQVTVMYRDEDGTQRAAVAGAGDAGQRTRLSLPGIQTYTMAKRHGTEVLNKLQADLRHEHVAKDTALADAIGDLHSITYAAHGLSEKVMRLVGLTEIERGRWRRKYIEYDEGLYNDSVFQQPESPDTDLPSASKPPTGPTPVIVEELYTDETATTYSRMKVTFSGTDWPYVANYKVTCEGEQSVLNTLIAHDGLVDHVVYSAAVKQGVPYVAKVWIHSSTGALSEVPGTSLPVVAQGKQLPPGDVPWMNASEVGGFIQAQWGAAEEIDGDLRGYTLKLLADAYHTGDNADWNHANAIVVAERLDAQSLLTVGPEAGTYYLCIKAIDTTGAESVNAICRRVIVTTDAWATNTTDLYAGELTNMHQYVIDGDAIYVVSSTGESWADRFGDTSPLATWGDAVTQSPAERWGGDLQIDSTFVTEQWDSGSAKDGRWLFSDESVTLLGGTQANAVALSGETSPIAYTDNAGNTVQATARYMKAKVYTADSPAGVGDGLHIKLPIQASFSGEVVPQSSSVTIPDDSPLVNPVAVVFTSPYADPPRISLTATGSVALIAVADNVTATGFDIHLFDITGARIAGTVYWSAEGT